MQEGLTHKPAALPQVRKLLSPAEFYEALDRAIGLNAIYGLINAGRVKSIRLGRKILIPHQEVWEWPEREVRRSP